MALDSSELTLAAGAASNATNVKVVSEQPAVLTNAMTAAHMNQMQLNQMLASTVAAKQAENIMATNPQEGITGNIMAAIMSKVFQTVPPVTP